MLVIKIDLEKNREAMLEVLELLKDFNVMATSWEDSETEQVEVRPISARSDGDLGTTLSEAIDRARKRHDG